MDNKHNIIWHNIIWDHNTLGTALGTNIPFYFQATGVSTDSRKTQDSDLFLGLSGKNVNGSNFAKEALKRGAVAAIIDKNFATSFFSTKALVLVDDVFEALYNMAKYKRNQTKARVIGITGSVGKTSTKEMLNLALRDFKNEVFASSGNFNNHYGLPISLARLPISTDYCILEMGMSHKGEIGELTQIARPDVAIITEVAPAHLEFFDSVQDIALAKAEIFAGMKPGAGIAVLNQANQYYPVLAAEAKRYELQVCSFGKTEDCDVQLLSYQVLEHKSYIKARCSSEVIEYTLSLAGEHFIINSLSVLAATMSLGFSPAEAASRLKQFTPLKGRGAVHQLRSDITLIDESYNASPASIKAAISKLAYYKAAGHRLITVLGDMKELGKAAVELHKDLLNDILAYEVDKVFSLGPNMEKLFLKVPEEKKGGRFNSINDLKEALASFIKPGDIIMVKGSASMEMDKIVQHILDIYRL